MKGLEMRNGVACAWKISEDHSVLRLDPKVGFWYVVGGTYIMKIEYVHQLQNLWALLTGKEIELKEPA